MLASRLLSSLLRCDFSMALLSLLYIHTLSLSLPLLPSAGSLVQRLLVRLQYPWSLPRSLGRPVSHDGAPGRVLQPSVPPYGYLRICRRCRRTATTGPGLRFEDPVHVQILTVLCRHRQRGSFLILIILLLYFPAACSSAQRLSSHSQSYAAAHLFG